MVRKIIYNRDNITGLLKPYFEKREDILMAFLFGSWATDRACKESDIDIAIYFKPKTGRFEWEDFDVRYEDEGDIWLDVERILRKEVDLLILNRARASVAWSAIRGVPIVIKDYKLFIDFMLEISRVAEEFMDFAIETWRMKEAIRCSPTR